MRTILLAVLLSGSVAACAQGPSAICEVRPSWSIKGGVRSARLEPIGRFQFRIEPQGKEFAVQSFKDHDPDVIVTAAIEFRLNYDTPKPKPLSVEVAITVSDKEKKDIQDIFESAESAAAATRYGKNWDVSVSKNLFVGDRTYIYTLRCWDTRSSQASH
jgi:hypothetical protein